MRLAAIPASAAEPTPLLETRELAAIGAALKVLPYSQPAGVFSGDFYKVHTSRDGLFFALGDVMGKGLEAAVVMAMIQETLEEWESEWESRIEDPQALTELVGELDQMLRRESAPNRFATLVVGRLTNEGELELVNAGHWPPLIVEPGGGHRSIPSHGALVGLLPGLRWRSGQERLAPGETLCLYTDGVVEALSPADEEYGEARLLGALAARAQRPLGELARGLLAEVRDHCHGPSQDDLTLLLIRHG